jgi:RNA polymerase sigma factor (sigma-70 family)
MKGNTSMHGDAESLSTRPSLLSKVRKGDEVAWSEFYGIYRKFIYGLARKGGLSHEDAEDLTQETMAKVAEHIDRFKPDKSRARFRAWLGSIVRNKLIDRARRNQTRPAPAAPSVQAQADESRRTATIERIADPNSADFETVSEQEWQKAILDAATRNVKEEANIKHFQIYDLYELRQMPAAEVARSLGVFVAQVYLAAHRIKQAIKQEATRLKKAEPPAPCCSG